MKVGNKIYGSISLGEILFEVNKKRVKSWSKICSNKLIRYMTEKLLCRTSSNLFCFTVNLDLSIHKCQVTKL